MKGMRERIESRLKELGDPERAEILQRFFKTGKGQYGEGDVFVGLRVPHVRRLSRGYRDIALDEIFKLLRSHYHEVRLLALILLVDRFRRGDDGSKADAYAGYLENTRFVNNWDLVDASAPHIVGAWLADRDRNPLYRLAISEILWERRIAIVATHFFIRNNDFTDTLKIVALLLDDPHDLIHKAAGWMLREVGNRDRKAEEAFLRVHSPRMPRTMLRYAIEKFPPDLRRRHLNGTG